MANEATKAVALTEAVKFATATGVKEASKVVEIARVFFSHFDDTSAAPAKPAAATTPAKPAASAAAKPAAAKPAAAPVKPANPVKSAEDVAADKLLTEVETEAPTLTKKDVSSAIVKLINANLRDQAVAMLAEYGADSVGSLDDSHYATVVARAAEMLTAA